MRNYTTPDGRDILIDIDLTDNIFAEHDGERIGTFEFQWSEDDDNWKLMHVNIDESFQRQGIGEQMVQEAVDHFEIFLIPPVNPPEDSDWFVTSEGTAFLNACIRKGLLPAEWRAED
jgi:GNAT superfamily N-acetyltransferase